MTGPQDLAGFPDALRERYVPKARLGAGSFGVVFRAQDRALLRDVAVKVFRGRFSEDLRSRFQREIRALATIEHPHIVTIYDASVTDDGAWIVMELLHGRPADEATLEDPLALMLDIAAGLQALHEESLLHRDVKPANLFVTAEGRGVLLDLGLVADPASTALTATGKLVGTLRYLAPEIFRGATPGAPADWYAWGASLFELAEGRPMRKEVPVAGLMAGIDEAPPVFTKIASDGAAAAAVRACVAAKPEDRPEGLAALRALLDRPSAARTPDRRGPEPAPPSPRRSRAMVLALAVAGIALGTGYLRRSLTPAPPAPAPARIRPSPARELARQLRAREDFDTDPRSYFRQLRRLPAMRNLLEGLDAGRAPWAEGAPLREELLEVDAALREREWMPLFEALVRPLPDAPDEPIPRGPFRLVLEEVPAALGGWAGEAIRERRRAQRAIDAFLEELNRLPGEDLAELPALLTLRMLGRPRPGALFTMPSTRRYRSFLARGLRPAAVHAHRSYVAAFRAITGATSDQAADRLALLLGKATQILDVIQLSELATLPPELLLGAQPRRPAEWLFVGRLLVVQALIQELGGDGGREKKEVAMRALVVARGEPGSRAGNRRSQQAGRELLKLLLRFEDQPNLLQLVASYRAALREHPGDFQRTFLSDLAGAILSLVRRGELPLSELVDLDRSLSAWRASHPDLRGEGRLARVHDELRETLEGGAPAGGGGGR